MAGVDKDIIGEATPMPGLHIGYLPQEPQLDPALSVRQEVESGMGEVMQAQEKLEAVYAAYAEAVSYTHLDVYKRQSSLSRRVLPTRSKSCVA